MTTAYAVSGVLDRRRRQGESALLVRCVGAAIGLHLLLVGGGWFIPRWLSEPAPPIEYVAIQIVPAARLGVEKPTAPPRPEPAAPPVKAPEPEPAKPAAVVQPKPAATAKSLAPAEAAKPRPKPVGEARAPESEPVPEVQGSERGAASGLALGASVAGLDNPDFTYGYYVDQMLAMIQRNWVRPMVGSGVETTIYYRIGRNGRIAEARIANSSGINSFDLAALRAVQASSPLPPLPRAFRDSWLGVHLIFR